jgi:hypothetical protein
MAGGCASAGRSADGSKFGASGGAEGCGVSVSGVGTMGAGAGADADGCALSAGAVVGV